MGLELNTGEESRLEPLLAPWGVGPGFGDEWLRIDGIAEYNPGDQLREPFSDRDGNRRDRLRTAPPTLELGSCATSGWGI